MRSSVHNILWLRLPKKSPYPELFFSAYFPDFPAVGLNTESVFSPNAGKSVKNADQNNFEYELFLRRVRDMKKTWLVQIAL